MNIRAGRTVREKWDTTPWSQVAPLKLTQRLPNLEIGLYKDFYNMSLSSSEKEDDPEEMEDNKKEGDEDDLQRIQSDLENKAPSNPPIV